MPVKPGSLPSLAELPVTGIKRQLCQLRRSYSTVTESRFPRQQGHLARTRGLYARALLDVSRATIGMAIGLTPTG